MVVSLHDPAELFYGSTKVHNQHVCHNGKRLMNARNTTFLKTVPGIDFID
jgi:hypothetical protein